jgi:hypothetical protein
MLTTFSGTVGSQIRQVLLYLKINAESTACRETGTGKGFAVRTISRDAKSVTSAYSAGEGARNSPVTAAETLLKFRS